MSVIQNRLANLTEEERKAIDNLPADKKAQFDELAQECIKREQEITESTRRALEAVEQLIASQKQLAINLIEMRSSLKTLSEKTATVLNEAQQTAVKNKEVTEKLLGMCLYNMDNSKLPKA